MLRLLVTNTARPPALLRMLQGNGLDVAGTVPQTPAVLILVIDLGLGSGADVDGCGFINFGLLLHRRKYRA